MIGTFKYLKNKELNYKQKLNYLQEIKMTYKYLSLNERYFIGMDLGRNLSMLLPTTIIVQIPLAVVLN